MIGDLRFLLYLKKPFALVERSGPPGTTSSVHGKTIIVDQQLSAVGSYNWDPRSGIWNAEIMVVIDDEPLAVELADYLEPMWSAQHAWVVGKLEHPLGMEQLDAIGSSLHAAISEMIGVNVWPLTNTACYELTGEKAVSPYDPEFHKQYRSVGSFPLVSMIDQKRILTNLLQPISGPLTPAL